MKKTLLIILSIFDWFGRLNAMKCNLNDHAQYKYSECDAATNT